MRQRASHKGQVLIIVALFSVALIAILALVLDGGNIYVQRRRMQNAADAGALAGARVLALNGASAQARDKAEEYTLTRNGAEIAEITVISPTVKAKACVNAAMTFGRAVGLDTARVCASANARFAAVRATGYAAPIAIRDFPYLFEVPYNIWDDEKDRDPTSGDISGGYRGWLNLECVYPMSCGDGGASQLKDWMRNGYPGVTEVGSWIRGSSGTMASVIQQAQVGQLLKIVVYNDIETKYPGKDYYHAVKFAVFQVTQVYATGNPKGIRGVFQYYVEAAQPSDGPDGGLRTLDLTD